MNLKSFLMGLSLGLSGKPLPISGGEPVAYLYNGVSLPKLPEWDRETYPYVVMDLGVVLGTITISVYFVKEPKHLCFEHVEYEIKSIYIEAGETFQRCTMNGKSYEELAEKEWNPIKEVTEDNGKYVRDYCVKWANYDVLDTDGTVYLAASEPIPVHE